MDWINPVHWNKGIKAFLITILFLGIGIAIIIGLKFWFNIQQDAVLIALLLIPVLAYLILSDKLSELSAGGITAKFNTTAQKPFFNKDEMLAEPIAAENADPVRKFTVAYLEQILPNLISSSKAGYLVLTVVFGKGGYYGNTALLIYLKALSRFQNFTFLVILNDDNEVLAYMEGWRVIQILEEEEQIVAYSYELQDVSDEIKKANENAFANVLNRGDMKSLLKYGVIRCTPKTTASPTDKSIDVLNKMTEKNMDALIVTDDNYKLVGVVQRRQILSKLLLAAAK